MNGCVELSFPSLPFPSPPLPSPPLPSPGYGRVVLALISFYYMPFDPVKAVLFYLLSGLLDAFDGWAARVFNQGKPTNSSAVCAEFHTTFYFNIRDQFWGCTGHGD